MKKPRIYVDTSVIGGCFDAPFKKASEDLFARALDGHLLLLISDLVTDELRYAPEKVRDRLKDLPAGALEILPITPEVFLLRDAYLEAGILTADSSYDAGHVAIATYHRADAIVSWNFKHIVQLGKMRAYNRVNSAKGYHHLDIISPMKL